ncbi:unnamed protein product [Ceutorhynchus assimilis]|uniref:ACB domain-containing protein n=1 Tax=Ceutorhynchus assimilis TaxID=467358 RepID=A0A9N9MCI5_9CUCU|nr:unnamed protein product [Ceutorhynchus assimilis]
MGLNEDFTAAASKVRNFSKRPSDSDMLEIYSLYKQATVGDVNIAKPTGGEALTKWNAWNGKKGLASNHAKEQYIAKVSGLASKYS